MIVVDTNVIAYSVLPGDRTAAALRLLEREPVWLAPPLWRSELRNVLVTSVRTGRIDLPTAREAFQRAESLVRDFEVEPATEDCLAIAISAGISAYDAEFVLAASRLGKRLVTADRRLVAAVPDLVIDLSQVSALHP